MSPLRLRASLSLRLLLLLLLLLGACLLAAAGRNKGGSVAESARGSAGGSSGRFLSPERHTCSWQLLLPAPGPAAGSELALRCQGPDGARHQCAYRGEPERCAAYAARGPHYWKQVLGGLRRKRRPCQDPTPLRARLCAGKKGHGADLRLVSPASPPAGPTAAGSPQVPKPRTRSRGLPREPAIGFATRVPPPSNALPKGKSSEKPNGRKRKVASAPDEERPLGTRPDPDGLTETYCAEKWHSLCSFFISFWNG